MNKKKYYQERINKQSPEPIYYQIYKIIKREIEDDVYNVGSTLPSEAFFERMFGVSRATVRKALHLLENDRYIVKEQGKGTKVLDYKDTFYWSRLTSFTTYLTDVEDDISSIILEFSEELPSPKVANLLSIKQDEKIYKLVRIRLINDKRIALSTCYISPRIPIKLDESMFNEKTSLFKLLEDAGLEIGNCDETIEAQIPSNELRELLHINDNVAVFYRERVTYDKNNNPFEYVIINYNADYYKYFMKSVAAQREKFIG